MPEKIEIVDMPSHFAAIVRTKSGPQSIGDDQRRCFDQVMAYLQKNGIQPAGAPVSFYFRIESETIWDIGAGFPVDRLLNGESPVEVITVPAGRVATLLHTGPYFGLAKSWKALENWYAAQDFKVDMNRLWSWESYLTNPDNEPDESKWQVKLYWKI